MHFSIQEVDCTDPQDLSPSVSQSTLSSLPRESTLSLANPVARCLLVFQLSNRANPAMPPLNDRSIDEMFAGNCDRPRAHMSDRIGLQHMIMAAKAQDMEVSLASRGDRVVFTARLWVDRGVQPSNSSAHQLLPAQDAVSVDEFPEGLCICCIDDSASQRHVLDHAVRYHLRPRTVHIFGNTVDDIRSPLHLPVLRLPKCP